jgi:hypothetical protein
MLGKVVEDARNFVTGQARIDRLDARIERRAAAVVETGSAAQRRNAVPPNQSLASPRISIFAVRATKRTRPQPMCGCLCFPRVRRLTD